MIKKQKRLVLVPLATAALLALGAATAMRNVVLAQPRAAGSASVPTAVIDPKMLSEHTIPDAPSDMPKNLQDRGAEWATAEPVRIMTRSPRAKLCEAFLLREYLKVRCPFAHAAIRQLAGDTADVEVFVPPKTWATLFAAPNYGEVVVPLRRDKGYLFQFYELQSDYSIYAFRGLTLDVFWPASQKAPTVVLQ